MVSRAELEVLVRQILTESERKCTPIFPHDTLRWDSGRRVYLCRCSQVYAKDGRGGLQLALPL